MNSLQQQDLQKHDEQKLSTIFVNNQSFMNNFKKKIGYFTINF